MNQTISLVGNKHHKIVKSKKLNISVKITECKYISLRTNN